MPSSCNARMTLIATACEDGNTTTGGTRDCSTAAMRGSAAASFTLAKAVSATARPSFEMSPGQGGAGGNRVRQAHALHGVEVTRVQSIVRPHHGHVRCGDDIAGRQIARGM